MPKLPKLKMKTPAVALALAAALFTLAACGGMTPRPEPELTVMTYNVYVGAPPDELLNVMSRTEVPLKVAEFYRNYQASNFPGRAAAIAKIIKKSQPHVIGLQEISLVRTQDPADSLTNPGAGPNATAVESDFLEEMKAALIKEGLNYNVAHQVETFDIEMPMPKAPGEFIDVRLTDHDVILVRNDVTVADLKSAAVRYQAELPVASLDIDVPRGYVAVDATVGGVTYRIVNTHLEHFAPQIRLLQTQELLASLKDETLPVILMGDFNTKAPNGAAYQAITTAGYTDVWQKGAGDTCCQADNLMNEMSQLGAANDGGRIDLIFTKGVELRPSASTRAYTVGGKAADRLKSGLWPSDHAGVVAHLPVVK